MKRIICKVLVIAILVGILPTSSIITPQLNVEASTTNSITVHGGTNRDVFRERAAYRGYSYEGTVIGRLNSGQTSEPFDFSPTPGNDFRLMLDSSMGDFTITLTDPRGNIFSTNDLGILWPVEEYNDFSPFGYLRSMDNEPQMRVLGLGSQGLAVTNPTPGQWQFTVTSRNTSNNMAFAIGIAKRPQAPFITNSEELIMLQDGSNVTVRGISPVDGRVHLVLLDRYEYALLSKGLDTVAGGSFSLDLPDLEDGLYFLLAQTTNMDGVLSYVIFHNVLIDGSRPQIHLSERFERVIFDDTAIFYGSATHASNVKITVNGRPAEVSLAWGRRWYDDTPPSASFFAKLDLQEGVNTVVITAISATGITTKRTVLISSDMTTPEYLRSVPRITNISIEDGSISVRTAVTFTVENSHLDDTIVIARAGWDSLEVTYIGSNTFSAYIDPSMFVGRYGVFEVFVENIWRNEDRVSTLVVIDQPMDDNDDNA